LTNLTQKKDWEKNYTDELVLEEDAEVTVNVYKQFMRGLLGPRFMDLISPYGDYLFWRVILREILPLDCTKFKVIEVGSAPGTFLVRFQRHFGSDVYGVEYTSNGVEQNRKIFKKNGINPKNVIEADFFSKEFLATNHEKYDVVISRGFIEHFTDVESVVGKHMDILCSGGLLVISIPNLHGVYGVWTRIFNPKQIPLHNLDIMKLDAFRKLYESLPIDCLHCDYIGTFNFWLFTAPPESKWACRFIQILLLIQRGLNLVFRMIFRDKGIETATFSPDLIFVGRKR
jgi:2-polyprenyl-3-methyl-5-hydroxy-6-metoxy-1,4-benzoquinol methylase